MATKLKLTQTILEKNFTIKHNGKTYYVGYLNSDGQILGLINRDNWEVYDEAGEELGICLFKGAKSKEKEQIKKNRRLYYKLIKYCIRHFNVYKPNISLY